MNINEFPLETADQLRFPIAREIGEGGRLIADPFKGDVFLPERLCHGARILKPVSRLTWHGDGEYVRLVVAIKVVGEGEEVA